MTPAKCSICGHAHWKNEPHIFAAIEKPKRKDNRKRDRKAYHREYWRKNRSAITAGNHVG